MGIDKIMKSELNPGELDMPLAYRLLHQLIEEKYQPLLDGASDFMCIVDREGMFVYVNKNLADSLGYTKKELMGMFFEDVVASESRNAFAEKTKQFLKSGKMFMENLVLKARSGSRIVGELSSTAFFDASGRFCGAKGVFKDHTKYLEIEELEKKYESMLEDGIDLLDQVIMIVDKDCLVRWASSSIGKYLGADKAAVVGLDVRVLFSKKLKGIFRREEEFLKNLLGAYESSSPVVSYECEVVGPTGVPVHSLEHWSYPIGHGALAGGRIEIFRDVTARKKAEETLEYCYQKIHAIMDHAVEGVVEIKADNSIVFVNKSFSDNLGVTETEMLGRPLNDFIIPDQRRHLISIKLIRRSHEMTFLKKDGTWLYALASAIPLTFGSQPPHILCFISDITDEKVNALKLRDANLALRAVNDSLVELSLRDVRTDVFNARYLNDRLSQEIQRARRSARSFSLLMLDIDFFKALNDTYGHSFGDLVLKGFAGILKESVRATDVVVRIGGDEFVVFLPDTIAEGGVAVARKIIRAVKATLLGDQTKKIHISISIGIAAYPDIGASADALMLMNAADQAMYKSKSMGRNWITVHDREAINPQETKAEPEGPGFLANMQLRLKNINLRNEEAVLESLRPMVRQVFQYVGYPVGSVEKILKNVEALGLSLSLTRREIDNLKRAALLANLGYLEIPQDIFLKEVSLSFKDLELIRRHPLGSALLVRDIPFLEPLTGDILCHHERFDGTGYPRGLSSENIPLGARIISLVESYEALLEPRPYRLRPYSETEALDIIRRESGKQFDPAIVEYFLILAA